MRPLSRHTALLSLAGLSTALCAVISPLTATIAWAVILLGSLLWRLPFLLAARPSLQAVIVLFVVSQGLWMTSDLLRLFADARPPQTVHPQAELTAMIAMVAYCPVIIGTVFMRGRPRLETWLDALIYIAALSPALWLGMVEPALDTPAAGHIQAWAACTLLLMFTGGVFLMSGGLWNAPSLGLVAGVVGNVAVDVALRIPDASAPAAAPHFLIGAMTAAFVAHHPDMERVFERGGRPAGIPLEARVWMLVATLTLPIGVLAYTYIDGQQAPIVMVGTSVAVIAVIVAIRAWFLQRLGVQHWSVPLTISVTALLVASTAIAMSSFTQSATRAQRAADATAALLPRVNQLDGLLLRAVRPGPGGTAAHADWVALITALRRSPDADVRVLVDRYVIPASTALRAAAAGDTAGAQWIVDRPAAIAQRELAEHVQSDLAARSAASAADDRRVRTFTVLIMALTLLAVGGLLLRFNAARRRIDLLHQATHDELTGLPNAAALERELAKSLPASVDGQSRALAILDLDHFKEINDSRGRGAGDAVITTVARRLEESVRSDHMVARLDGDAFGVLIPPGADPMMAAQRILAALALPVMLGDGPHALHGSVGLADVDEQDHDRHTAALRDAELAMYQAKRAPGNSVERFSADIDERVRGRLQLIADLREALSGEGLHLAYQPIVDLQSGQIAGYEALIRWNHPVRGPLSPAEFIPVAEESGLIVELGGWVLRRATAQLAAWQRDWQDDRYVSVNVAAAQFTAGALGSQLEEALRESGLSPRLVLLEVTESTLMEDVDANVAQLEAVRALGVRVALDDFGTGYSSLSYLRRFPVDVVKVDKAFIDALDDPDGSLLVRAIVDLSTGLRLRVVAEGIEHVEQAAALQQFGCTLGQGYHFSRPVSPLEIQAAAGRFEVPPARHLRALP